MELVKQMLANRERAGLPAQGAIATVSRKPPPNKHTATAVAARTPYQELEAMKMEIIEKKPNKKEVKKWLEKLVEYREVREEQIARAKEEKENEG